MSLTKRTPLPEKTPSLLSEWNKLIDDLVAKDRLQDAMLPIRIILNHFPRNLFTYQRLLDIYWQLGRMKEGHEWGRRLLRADPGNSLAWRAVAAGVEQEGERAQARQLWQRAFDANPYDPEIRAGLSRTSIHEPAPLSFNQACIASLLLRTRQWQRAQKEYESLVNRYPLRIDFQLGRLISQWQNKQSQRAYQLALHLLQLEKNLLFPWIVLDMVGDVNDKALAHNPIQLMDADGSYCRTWLGVDVGLADVEVTITKSEVELLGMLS